MARRAPLAHLVSDGHKQSGIIASVDPEPQCTACGAETADRGASEFPPSLMGLIGRAEARRMSDVQSRGWLWIGYGTTWVLVLF